MLEKDKLEAETKASKQNERSLVRGVKRVGAGNREQGTEKGFGKRLNKLFACCLAKSAKLGFQKVSHKIIFTDYFLAKEIS